MRSNRPNYLYYSFLALILLSASCKNKNELPPLGQRLADSIYVYENSGLPSSNGYKAYLRATSTDSTIHTEKEVTNTYYPWKVNLNKGMVDSFLVDLEKNLKVEKNYKSASGEFSSIGADFIADDKNNVMSTLLTCKLAAYDLKNSKGEKIIIDVPEVSINKNLGRLDIGLAKWDLNNQHIKGEVTLEITIPYKIEHIEVKPGDRNKSFPFGGTKIDILEFQHNAMHYRLGDSENYEVSVLIDNCMGSTSTIRFPQYFYEKLRMKPNLSYKEFIADSVYFELGTKLKKQPFNTTIIYRDSCDPDLIYLYGFRKSDLLTRRIKVPIDTYIK